MSELIVTTRGGTARRIHGVAGISVMAIIRDNGFDELLAMCGGCCSCATCHVYIDEADWHRFSPIGADEDDLLESSEHRTGQSRLSCQIVFDEALSGLHVTIAPEE